MVHFKGQHSRQRSTINAKVITQCQGHFKMKALTQGCIFKVNTQAQGQLLMPRSTHNVKVT